MMHVFGSIVLQEFRRGLGFFGDLLQPLQDFTELFRRQHSSVLESTRMSPARRYFKRQQTLIEGERSLPLLERTIEWLAEAP
jgi:hypothetical protein